MPPTRCVRTGSGGWHLCCQHPRRPTRRQGRRSSPAALLAAHLDAVARAPEGRRRTTLYGAARGVARMVAARAITPAGAHAVNASTAAVHRSIGSDEPPTLLVDEADTTFGGKQAEADEELRGLLNAGHQRNRPRTRLGGRLRRQLRPELRPRGRVADWAAPDSKTPTVRFRRWAVLKARRRTWWPGAGSNRRPSDFQSDARTN